MAVPTEPIDTIQRLGERPKQGASSPPLATLTVLYPQPGELQLTGQNGKENGGDVRVPPLVHRPELAPQSESATNEQTLHWGRDQGDSAGASRAVMSRRSCTGFFHMFDHLDGSDEIEGPDWIVDWRAQIDSVKPHSCAEPDYVATCGLDRPYLTRQPDGESPASAPRSRCSTTSEGLEQELHHPVVQAGIGTLGKLHADRRVPCLSVLILLEEGLGGVAIVSPRRREGVSKRCAWNPTGGDVMTDVLLVSPPLVVETPGGGCTSNEGEIAGLDELLDRVSDDPAERQRRAWAGREVVRRRCSMKAVVSQLDGLLRVVAAAHPSDHSPKRP